MAAILKGTKVALIAANASLSGTVSILKESITGILMSAAWTTADLTFQASMDTVTWYEIKDVPQADIDTARYRVQAPAAGEAIPLDMAVFAAWAYMRVRSGTSALPVVQTEARTLYLTTWGE